MVSHHVRQSPNLQMLLAYHLDQLPFDRIDHATQQLIAMGYRGCVVSPSSARLPLSIGDPIDEQLRQLAMQSSKRLDWTIDARQWPILADQPVALDPLEHPLIEAIDLAHAVGATKILVRSGTHASDQSLAIDPQPILDQLGQHWSSLSQRAAAANLQLLLVPTAGDVIATTAQLHRLQQWLDPQRAYGIAVSVATMARAGELPLAHTLPRYTQYLGLVLADQPSTGDSYTDASALDWRRISETLRNLPFVGTVLLSGSDDWFGCGQAITSWQSVASAP
jgi:sugar phosphate isomerase/epimerase